MDALDLCCRRRNEGGGFSRPGPSHRLNSTVFGAVPPPNRFERLIQDHPIEGYLYEMDLEGDALDVGGVLERHLDAAFCLPDMLELSQESRL